MYLLKSVHLCDWGKGIEAEDGLEVSKLSEGFIVTHEFWGETHLHFSDGAEEFVLKKTDAPNRFILPCITTFWGNGIKLNDCWKRLDFGIDNSYLSGKIDGYIVFIERSGSDIRTDGRIFFQRYSTEIVALLEEGNYLEFEGRKLKVIDGLLMASI